MYLFTLTAHNFMRWIIVLLAVYALVRIFMGVFGKREFTETDRKALSFYAIGMDIQLLLGLLLYFFLSPITTAAFGNFGAAMGNSAVRFFAVEHILLMVVAVVLAHLAGVMVKRATTSAAKFNRAAIWLTLSVLAVLAGIPWTQAPLFRLGAVLQYFV
ncbi:MAG: hypothetical protein V9G12_10135 [Microthrixaceae bacterium]|jgi:hypothetical protein